MRFISVAIQRKLLSEAELTLKKASDIALSMEMAEKEAKKLSSEITEKANMISIQCFRCGKSNHQAESCFHKKSTCHKCQKVGHLSKMCSSTHSRRVEDYPTKPGQSKNQRSVTPSGWRGQVKKKTSKVNRVKEYDSTASSDVSDEEEKEGWPVFTIKLENRKEIKVKLKIDSHPLEMELDTGASVSLIPESLYNKELRDTAPLKSSRVILRTYTGEIIPVLGELTVQVEYGSQKMKLPLLVVKSEGPALLGRNWLRQLSLNWRAIHYTMTSNAPNIKELSEVYSVFDEGLGTVKGITATLKVKPGAQPKFFKPRPVPFALKDKIADELHRLEREGILEKVDSSEWATPIVPVLKPDNTVRICGDYKVTINPVLDVPEYPLPTAEEIFTRLNGGEKFSKLDLSHAYQQVLLDEESRDYVTINTHLGLYRYTRLPFGVAAAPAIFQHTMDQVLQGIDGMGYILDDILITGKDDAEHKRNLEATLQRLDDSDIKLKRSKCSFMQDEVEYFAFRVNRNGIHPSPKKVEAILELEDPKNKKELQSWLGIVNYYRKFVPNMSTVVQPLTHLLANDVQWVWSQDCVQTCKEVKRLLASSEVLVHYNPSKPVVLAVDASAYGLGAVISHYDTDMEFQERPIAYASRTLTSAERNYSQIEKEALAIVFGIQKFHQYLYGRRFTLWTDHKPLTLILGPKKGIPVLAASRIQRWAIQLSAYQFDIKYRSTDKNGNADTLSRFPLQTSEVVSDSVFYQEAELVNKMQVNSLPITAKCVAAATRNDKWLSRVAEFTKSGWPQGTLDSELLPYHRIREELTIEEDCLLRGVRVIVPERHREEVLTELHRNHPGMVRMKALARLHVWWPDLDTDIEIKVARCEACKKQLPNLPKAQANPWIWPQAPWKRIHVDFAGPFMKEMFLIVVDAHSKWLDVVRMSSTTAESTINALRYIFSSYGIPKELVSDNGPQFVSEEFEKFMKGNGITHIRSAPYHPSSNGEAERAVRTFKQAMKTMESEHGSLNQKLASFLLSYRTTPHSTTKTTPSELFLGRKVRTRLDAIRPNLAQSVQKRSTPQEKKTRSVEIGDIVMVRDYRGRPQKPSWIRGIVLQKLGPVTYRVQVDDLQWKRHIDQIREGAFEYNPKTEEHKTPQVDDVPTVCTPPTEQSCFPENVPVASPETSRLTDNLPQDRQVESGTVSLSTPVKNSGNEPQLRNFPSSATKPRYPSRERHRPHRLIDNC